MKRDIWVEGKSQALRILEVSHDQLWRLVFVVAPGILTPELCKSLFPGSRLALKQLNSFHCPQEAFTVS